MQANILSFISEGYTPFPRSGGCIQHYSFSSFLFCKTVPYLRHMGETFESWKDSLLFNRLLLSRDAQLYQMQVSSWMVHMESALTKGGSLVDDLNARCVLFIKVPCSVLVCRTRELWLELDQHSLLSCVFVFVKGVLIAHTVSHLVRTIMNMYLVLSKPLTKAAALALCRLTELLKVNVR